MRKFAEGTSVSVESSFSEIRRIIIKYGASDFGIVEGPEKVMILFTVRSRRVQFVINMPDPQGKEFTRTPTGRQRSGGSFETAYDSEVRRLWRSLCFGKWRPSIFMPRWASRILLEITNIRVERLRDISEEDAIAEGWPKIPHTILNKHGTAIAGNQPPIYWYSILWDKINGKKHPWANNDWVWVIEYKRIQPV